MDARTIMVIRHGEKPDATGAQGVDESGHSDPRGLSARGWQRAGALLRFFAPRDGHFSDPRIRTPQTIFAATPNASSRRSPLTVQPLAEFLGLSVRCEYSAETQVAQLLDACDHVAGAVLVCWRHTSMRQLAEHLLQDAAAAPEWDANRFDLVWVFTGNDGRWSLQQVPQLLLPRDGTTA